MAAFTHHHAHGRLRPRYLLPLALTLAYAGVELAGGLWSGSLALLGDAGHMFSDAVALGVAAVAASELAAQQAPKRPKTKGKPRYQVHPAVGVARLGNSPDEYYLEPEEIGALYPGDRPGSPVTIAAAPLDPEQLERAFAFTEVVDPEGGSNAWAVAGELSATGAPLLANDPHLGLSAPNNWYLVRIETPELTLAGATAPGVPHLILGQNGHVAWGMTTPHSDTSDLFVERVDPQDADRYVTPDGSAPFDIRQETIRVRWGRDRRIAVRETRYGPIISDAPLLRAPRDRRLALYWLGHRTSDETSAMLALNRARSWDDFMTALDGMAIPALNMIYADTEGRVGQALAAWLPRRPPQLPPGFIADMADIRHWDELVTARDLPHSLDPPQGFVASANDRPPPAEVLIGHFFSPDNRIARLREVLEAARSVSVADLARLQQDVRLPAALELRAEPDGTGWRLTGTKKWISNAPCADFYSVFARTGQGEGARGVTAFLVPAIAAVSAVGVYAVHSTTFDLLLMVGLGVFGYILRKMHFPMSPLILGFVLGEMLEQNLRRALSISNGEFGILWSSSIAQTLLVLAVAVLALPPLLRLMRKRSHPAAEAKAE